MEHNPNKRKIIDELRNGRKTWSQLMRNSEMSSKTLWHYLMRLMDDGIAVKYGVVEYGKVVDYYDLVTKKNPPIVVKVARMFEKGDLRDFLLPRIKKDLDIEQELLLGNIPTFNK